MRKTRTAVLLVGLAIAAAACGHKDQPTTSTGSGGPITPTSPTEPPTPPQPPTPTPDACVYTVAADPDDFDRDGGNGKLTIATAATCKWTIKGDATWVAVEGPTQGEGPATLKFSAQANDGAPDRRMTLAIADKSIAISQPGQGDCAFQVGPVQDDIPRLPWSGVITVATSRGCRWTAVSDASWFRLKGAGGSGPGQLSYEADFNPETAYAVRRTALVAIRWTAPTAGQNVRIVQWGACNVALAPPPEGAPGFSGYPGGSVTFGPAGGQIHLFVLTDPYIGCAWTVESADSWIAVNFPGLHQVKGGDGDLRFTVPANPLASSRQGVLTIGDRALTVIQQGR